MICIIIFILNIWKQTQFSKRVNNLLEVKHDYKWQSLRFLEIELQFSFYYTLAVPVGLLLGMTIIYRYYGE